MTEGSIDTLVGVALGFAISFAFYLVQRRDSDRDKQRLTASFARTIESMSREHRLALLENTALVLDPALDTDDLYLPDSSDVRHVALLGKRKRDRLKLALRASGVPEEKWRETAFRTDSEWSNLTEAEKEQAFDEVVEVFRSAGFSSEADEVQNALEGLKKRTRSDPEDRQV